jgi:leucyl-tRNA synthetase
MESYGADTARWFMLSDSPPDRDVIWTEDGVAGAHRFVQRVWRIVSEWAETRKTLATAGGAIPNAESAAALALRKATHRALATAEDSIAGFRFNVAVAKIYELVNAIGAATAGAAGDRTLQATVDDALSHLAVMLAPMMPHLAEECWAALGHEGLVANAPWPTVDRGLLVEETVTLPVQINGKKRDELTIAAGASQADIEQATLALDTVRRALDGRKPKKIVVVPKRIVNVVA